MSKFYTGQTSESIANKRDFAPVKSADPENRRILFFLFIIIIIIRVNFHKVANIRHEQ